MAILHLATASLAGASDVGAALEALAGRGWRHAFVGEALGAGPGGAAAIAAWEDRCWVLDRGPGPHTAPPWNLAAVDEEARRAGLREALEVRRARAGRGARHHVVRPGWALTLGSRGAEPVPWKRAFDQLCRSLDSLAGLAEERGLRIAVPTRGPDEASRPLGGEPEALAEALTRVGAPQLGLLLDLQRWATRGNALPGATVIGVHVEDLRASAGEPASPLLEALLEASGPPLRVVLTPPPGPLAELTHRMAEAEVALTSTGQGRKLDG